MEEQYGEDFPEMYEAQDPMTSIEEATFEELTVDEANASSKQVLQTDETEEKIEDNSIRGFSESVVPSAEKQIAGSAAELITLKSGKSVVSFKSVGGEAVDGEDVQKSNLSLKAASGVVKSERDLPTSELLNISASTIRSLASTLSSSVLSTADKIQIQRMVDRLLTEAEELALHPSQSMFTNSQLGLTRKGGKTRRGAEGYEKLNVLYEQSESEYASKIPSIMELYALDIDQGLTLNDFAWPKFAPEEPDQVYESLLVMTVMNPNLSVIQDERVIMRKDHYETMENKVKIIIGGRAGNEPLFTGYVGKGMATAAVVGDRKNAPKSLAIYKTIKELSLHHTAGILIMIPNEYHYRIVFGLAMERARSEGLLVDMMVISDDCYDNVNTKIGRRCLAGFVLSLKVAGAMAEDERTLKEVYLTVQSLLITTISAHVNDGNVIMGTGFREGGYEMRCACNLKEEDCSAQPLRECADYSHNKLRDITEIMMDYLTGYKRYFSLPLKPFAQVVLFVNCYTEDKLFLNSVVAEVLRQVYCQDVVANRIYAGTFVSSRRGFSISFLKVFNEEIFHWLDYPTSVEAWPSPRTPGVNPVVTKSICDLPLIGEKRCFGPKFTPHQQIIIPYLISHVMDELVQTEEILNELDPSKTFGTNLVKVAIRVARENKNQTLNYSRPYNLCHEIAMIAEEVCYGADGSLMALFIGAIANEFLKFAESLPIEPRMFGQALISGSEVVKMYCKIRPEIEAYVGDVCIPVGAYLMDVSPLVSWEEILNRMFVETKKEIGEARFKPQGNHLRNKEESRSVAVLFILKALIRARKKLVF